MLVREFRVSRDPEPTNASDADDVERHPCPRCALQPGSPCRTRSGAVDQADADFAALQASGTLQDKASN